MHANDRIQIVCPNLHCKAGLRVKATLEGKRLKCPVCGFEFEAPRAIGVESESSRHTHKHEESRRSRSNPWLLATAVGVTGVLVVALFAYLWLGAKSELRGLRAQAASAEEKNQIEVRGLREQATAAEATNQRMAFTIEGIKQQLAIQEKLVGKLVEENAKLKTHLSSAEKESTDARNTAKENEKLLIESKKQVQVAKGEAAEAKELLAATKQRLQQTEEDLDRSKKDATSLAKKEDKKPVLSEKKPSKTTLPQGFVGKWEGPSMISLELKADGTASCSSAFAIKGTNIANFEYSWPEVFIVDGKRMIRMQKVDWSIELSADGQSLTLTTQSPDVSPGTVKLRKK